MYTPLAEWVLGAIVLPRIAKIGICQSTKDYEIEKRKLINDIFAAT